MRQSGYRQIKIQNFIGQDFITSSGIKLINSKLNDKSGNKTIPDIRQSLFVSQHYLKTFLLLKYKLCT